LVFKTSHSTILDITFFIEYFFKLFLLNDVDHLKIMVSLLSSYRDVGLSYSF